MSGSTHHQNFPNSWRIMVFVLNLWIPFLTGDFLVYGNILLNFCSGDTYGYTNNQDMIEIKKPSLSVLSSLPPVLGISNFTLSAIKTLAQCFSLQILAYYRFYPPFLRINTVKYGRALTSSKDFEILYSLSIINPFSWVRTYRNISSPVVLMEWWNVIQLPHYIFLSYLLKKKNIKIFAELHNPVSHEGIIGERVLFNIWMRLVDLVIVHTECSGNAVDHDSIHVIPYGVYPCEDIPAKEARKKFSIPNEAKVLLFFGNLRPYKGLDLLLKSFKHIARNDKNVWLIIAGRPWKDFDDYLNLINSFGEDISSRIILRDEFIPESQVPFYFSAADLLVLPYKQFDSQSGVIMLTISCGLPYVVSDVKGLREFALDSSLISKVDSQDLSFVIERILSSPSKLEELHSDLKSLRAKYSWVNYARKIKELWNISVNTKEEE